MPCVGLDPGEQAGGELHIQGTAVAGLPGSDGFLSFAVVDSWPACADPCAGHSIAKQDGCLRPILRYESSPRVGTGRGPSGTRDDCEIKWNRHTAIPLPLLPV